MDKKIPGEYTDKAGNTRRVTARQRRIAALRVRKPYATQKEIGAQLGMPAANVAKELAKPHVKDQIRELMNLSPKLRIPALLGKLEQGLDSTELKSVTLDEDSKIRPSVEVPDYAVRHKYLDTALKLHGALNNDEAVAAGGAVNLSIILGGGGSEAEQQGVVDVLIAARISRGLHPTENRRMTDVEALEFHK